MTGRCDLFDKSESAVSAPSSSLYDTLLITTPRKRNRQWEKQQRTRKAVYRGVDPKLALQVRTIAAELRLPAGEVACAVIDYALRSYERGDFDLSPRPDPVRRRMTLFPRRHVSHPIEGGRRSKRQKQPETLWRFITTWRNFSPELKRELAILASDDGLHVPIGELVTALLRFGLHAHETGLLRLEVKPKSITGVAAQKGKS